MLNEAVRERGLAVINVGNYGKVSNMLSVGHRWIGRLKRARVYTGTADSPTRRVIVMLTHDDSSDQRIPPARHYLLKDPVVCLVWDPDRKEYRRTFTQHQHRIGTAWAKLICNGFEVVNIVNRLVVQSSDHVAGLYSRL